MQRNHLVRLNTFHIFNVKQIMKFKSILSPIIYILLVLTTATSAFANTQPVDDGNGTLSGTVTSKADSTTIPGATVTIPDLKIATATDSKGHYVLSHLPKGTYLVSISSVGYATATQKIDLAKVSVFSYNLLPCYG